MKRCLAALWLLLVLSAGSALAGPGDFYQNREFPPYEALKATFDTKDIKFERSLGRWREADDKYTLWYLSRYQERQPSLASLTIYKLDSNLWVYQFGQQSYVVKQAGK
jgi:hypothetical protein